MKANFKNVSRALLILFFIGSLSGVVFSLSPEKSLIKDFRWRNIEPASMIGRISDFETLESDFTHVLVAGASGGVWKSVNAGTTW